MTSWLAGRLLSTLLVLATLSLLRRSGLRWCPRWLLLSSRTRPVLYTVWWLLLVSLLIAWLHWLEVSGGAPD